MLGFGSSLDLCTNIWYLYSARFWFYGALWFCGIEEHLQEQERMHWICALVWCVIIVSSFYGECCSTRWTQPTQI
jgi:hypothetical protein